MSKATKRHMAKLAASGCVICRKLGLGETPAQLHHVREGQGMSQRASDMLAIPLCHAHHMGDAGIHGMGVKAFERLYRTTELELLAEALEAIA